LSVTEEDIAYARAVLESKRKGPFALLSDFDIQQHNARLDRILASITTPSVPSLDGWKPIETAPKDGTCFLAFSDREYVKLFVCSKAPAGQGGEWHNRSANRWATPTHWRPLPAPPSSPEGGGGEKDDGERS
jgi:hypothetical protein